MFKLTSPKFWVKKNIISYILLPFSFIYIFIIFIRKYYLINFKKRPDFNVPIIIVGNISVGGTGKTPLVIYLVELLRSRGYNPGVISRGYGGKARHYPILVNSDSKVAEVGDEAMLIYQRTQCQVVISPVRVDSVKKLLSESSKCDVIISDDGLQHYFLKRDIEVVVIDGKCGFGNGFCLPAGPLREPVSRLQYVDYIVKNGDIDSMYLEPGYFYNILNSKLTKTIENFKGQVVHAVAGIGNPARFFETLRELGLIIIEHPFPDHYVFKKEDLVFDDKVVIMTEKDAVKCATMARDNWWCLSVDAKLSSDFNIYILNKIGDFYGYEKNY